MRRRILAFLLPVALLAGGAGVLISRNGGGDPQAGPDREVEGPPVVVLLQLDEFPVDALRDPNGRIDAARFPHFAALARTSTWFPNTFAAHDETPYATPAIMDGRRPKRGRPATVAGHPRSVFTLFGDHGYKVVSSEEATDICPNRLCPGAAKRRKGILENLARGRQRRFKGWLRKIRRRRGPAFYFKHALLPHHPWVFLPTGRRVHVTLAHLNSPRGFYDPWLTRTNEERFLLQVGYVDWAVGRLVHRLRQQGLFDRALIAITADHGMSFDVGVHDRRAVTRRDIDEIAPVPFFLKAPGQTAGRVERGYGGTIDIAPTIAALMQLPINWHVDGRSRLGGPRRPRIVRMPTRSFNGVLRIGGRELERRRKANIRRRARRYGTGAGSFLHFGSPWTTVYREGPRPSLVGRRLSGLRRLPSAEAAQFAGGERWRSVRPRAAVVSTQVAGWIPGGRRAGRRIVAAAVNGRIQSVARTFRFEGAAVELFSLMVPDSSLRTGRNRVELFEVRGRGRSLRLLRLARSS
ncbi:MAG: sulfatase-like hydrolase/transferase [Thermoleophilaceae bacterium]